MTKGAAIIRNAKTRRVSVCNALDCVLVHRERVADLPVLCGGLSCSHVTIYADPEAFSALQESYPAELLRHSTDESYGTEFLDYKMAVKVLSDPEEAVAHIARYGSGHSECIVTEDSRSADYFMKLFQLIVASLASYGFARYSGKLRSLVFFSYVILMLMPYQVTLVPNYLVAEKLNILNTYWAIWLPGIFSPFAVYLLTKFMKRIPVGVMEAAQIDGAGEWQIYRLICMPLCKGALCSAAILVFIDYWNMVEQPLILLSDAEMHPLSVFLSKINSGEIGLAFAVATIYMVPSLLVFLYGEEYLVDGITYQGGVKG